MRTYLFSGAFLALAFFIPVYTHAAVVINEIAWMGTVVSATDEWIELHNDGTDEVSLSGWRILASDGSPSISLSGVISPDGYYLLERTDDNSVPEASADKIYTGDLGNTGETLTLLDANGATIDTITSGTDWESIGGYNETKDTPQRQSDNTWITGIPTPKAVNTTTAVTPPASGEVAGSSTTTTSTSSTRKRTITGGYKQIVFGYAGENLNSVVGIMIPFDGFAVSDKNILLPKARYQWSFGDGSRAQGRHVRHAYEEPGIYTVTLRVYDEEQKWQDKISATVISPTVTINEVQTGDHGYIEVSNDTDTELDLSNWKLAVLRDGSREKIFSIPEMTFIAPHTSVKFSSHITDLIVEEKDSIELRYPSSIRVSRPTRNFVVATSSLEVQ